MATAVYSDRFFRYGRPLRARAQPARRLVAPDDAPLLLERPAPPPLYPAVPLPLPPPPARRAGVLQCAPPPVCRAPRARAPPCAVFEPLPSEPFAPPAEPDWRRARRDVAYRQSAHGAAAGPGPRAGDVPRPARGARGSLTSLRSRLSLGGAVVPQFAREDAAPYERVYCAVLAKPPRVSEVNVARGPPDKLYGKPKVLNTERFNNGERVPARKGLRAEPPADLQRATLRVLLCGSGALYALALLAFYFLALPA